MEAALILGMYIADELLSVLTPYSSGPFAIAIVALYAKHTHVSLRKLRSAFVYTLATYVVGAAGGLLSGSPLNGIFLMTPALLAAVCLCGSELRGPAALLIAPSMAYLGVLVSMIALMLSLLGYDVYSVVSGVKSNRDSGLFLEPSHLALYVMPLWLIAFQRRDYRPWLYAFLLLMLTAAFSVTLIAILIIAASLNAFVQPFPKGSRGPVRWVRLVLVTSMVLLILIVLPIPITIAGTPVKAYVADRLIGLVVTGSTESYNLSSLVVLQGVELAYHSFIASFGLGVGLGNLGLSQQVLDRSTYLSIIKTVLGGDLSQNVRDGGILVNKLVGELGACSLLVAVVLKKSAHRLRLMPCAPEQSYHQAMAGLLVSLLFVRGLSYFAAPTCLAILSVTSLLGHRPITTATNEVPEERPVSAIT